jgi:SAM-dependent methyltransferase
MDGSAALADYGPISPNDHMMTVAPEYYGPLGLEAVKLIKGAVGFSYLGSVSRVLDFGCGHGRVLRHLRSEFPKATVWGADIDHNAVLFCAEQLGARPVLATTDFEAMDLPADLDVIWVGSLFTHLSHEVARRLFKVLTARLAQGGVLVATFHGRRVLQRSATKHYIHPEAWAAVTAGYAAEGWGHAPYAGQEQTGFGVSLSTTCAVIDLRGDDEDLRLVAYAEGAWGDHQDVAAWMRWPIGC